MRGSLDKVTTLILRYTPFVLAFLTPLFFLPITADSFTFNKFYLVTGLATVSLLAWCLKSIVRGKIAITLSPSLLPLFLLTLVHIISSVWLSPTQHASLFGQTAFFASILIIFFTVSSSQKSPQLVDTVIFGLVLSTALLSVTTILHYFGLIGKVFSLDLLDSKFFNPAGGVMVAFIFTLIVLLATLSYLIISKDWLKKSLLFASSIFMIVALLINLTLILPQDGQQVIFLLPYHASWSIAVDIFKNWQTALFGTGPDTYLTTYTRLRPGYLNSDSALWALRFPESSSFFLTLTTTLGLAGVLTFIASFLRPIALAVKHRSSQLDNPSFVFLLTALVGVLISFTFTPASIASLVLGLVSLIALTVEFKLRGLKNVKDISFSLSAKNEPETFYQSLSDTTPSNPYGVILPWIVTLLSSILIFLYWSYAIPTYQASMEIRQASNIADTNPVGAYLKQVNAIKLDPFNSNYPILLSQFFKNAALGLLSKKDASTEDRQNATEYMQRSIDYGKQAATLNPFSVMVWENLADVYQSFIGVADGAENFAVSHLAQAVALDPTNPELRLKLGTLFFNLGDSDQAIKLISQSIELKQDWNIPYYNMALIYRSRKDYARALQYLKVGLQHTETSSENRFKFEQEIAAVEKLSSSTASPSATPK